MAATTSMLSAGLLTINSPQPGGAHGQHHPHHAGSTSRVPRVISNLPTVRCATCGRELALDQLGDHSCVPNTNSPPPSLPSPSPPTSPAPAPAPSRLHSPSPTTPVMMMHPRALMPGDPRPMMARTPSPLPPKQNQFIEQNQQLPGRMIPHHQQQQQQRPPQPPWEPPMQYQPMPQRQAPLPPSSPPMQLDTKSGGEAGMAGVGRRGFAMVAAAAMFAASAAQVHNNHTPVPTDPGRRFNVPQYLDINSANAGDRATPPLSSPNSSSYSPISPPRAAFPYTRTPSPALGDNTPPSARSRSREAAPNSRNPKPEPLDMHAAAAGRFPFNNRLKQSSPVEKRRMNKLLSPTGTQASDNELSYLREAVVDETPRKPAPIRGGPVSTKDDDIKVRFPSAKDRRIGNASTSSSYSSSSGPSVRLGATLERSLSTPFEAPSSPSYSQVSSKDVQADRLNAQLVHPTRSNTSPALGSARPPQDHPTTRRRSEKKCVKCGKRITDGKWILVDQETGDGGKVLCEYDWKMLYLPKCRRCDRPIEGQAIGSSDGQIKGKYHRDCFNCTTCQTPFPDKSFYVFDGKPFCEYHYHEANNSLCSSLRCGMPIEGPCAVAHNGDRYHPAHFLCEFRDGQGCKVRLDGEYWELDGLRLCDRHAREHPAWREDIDESEYDDEDDDYRIEMRDSLASLGAYESLGGGIARSRSDRVASREGRAQKRVTRLIAL